MVITHIVAANCDDPPPANPPRLRRWGYWSSPLKGNNVSDVFQGGVAKWPNAFDCKSNLNVVRTFESCLLHKIAHLNNVQVEINPPGFADGGTKARRSLQTPNRRFWLLRWGYWSSLDSIGGRGRKITIF